MSEKYTFKTELRHEWYIFLIIAAVLILGVVVYPALPEQIVVHWNVAGEPDGYGSRFFGVFGLPLITLGLYLLLLFLPVIDPRRRNYAQFATVYRWIKLGVVLFMLGLHLVTLAFNLGYRIDIGNFVTLAIGFLFALLGRGLPQIKPNYFVGIRTPWTLANAEVWTKTHRFGGKLFFWSGVALVIGTVLPDRIRFWLMMALIMGSSLGTAVYSYFCFRQENNANEE
ncbi:MAG TPA: SdpI family protein [Firmicutes bacterium]|uniref:SdpI family protein n=1 Tax=Capillibacterium thermochitinicola TaxID=2699427 RepID=A0A8J6LRW7_9FIRM|nr:SdpI family protein [Capillibacterium thermochitinicola]MBA2132587.1 SdpI family protein [Capillibacterium thermochitinicola]HHW11854.1 SdpI family protein [Bacillota bacterium]